MDEEVTASVTASGGAQRAGSLAELRAAGMLATSVAGRKIALFVVEGDIVATQGRCPHARGPLHEGDIEGCVLTCPWHGYTFNLHTGACEEDPDLKLERFKVTIQGDDVLVSLP